MQKEEKEYKLCYIDENKAWFTDNFEHCWGDDFDDAPYDCNAGEPYEYWSELIEDNEDLTKRRYIHHPIEHKTLYFETNDWTQKLPCDGYVNSPYSVEGINKGEVPWLWTEKYKIDAGCLYEDFIKIIKENGGKIYVEMED